MTTMTTIMAIAAKTPITIPAIAPPESVGLEEPLLPLTAEAVLDSVGVVDATATDEDKDKDEDVALGIDDELDVDVDSKAVEVLCLASISLSGRTSKAKNCSLAFFLQIPHEYPALESHAMSRYIETHRLEPSGSQVCLLYTSDAADETYPV